MVDQSHDEACNLEAPPRTGAARVEASAKWGGLPLRLCLKGIRLVAGLIVLLLVVGGLFVVQLSRAPLTLDWLAPRVAAALNARVGHGFTFRVGETALSQESYGPTLTVAGLALTTADGQLLLSAPRAEVSLDPLALVVGKIVPRRLELFELEIHLTVQPDGSVSLSAAPGATEAATPSPPLRGAAPAVTPTAARAVEIKQASAAIRLLIDGLTNPDSPVAAIDRVGVSHGRLVVEDPTIDRRSVFEDVELRFDKSTGGLSSFRLAATGPTRRWSADATADGTPSTDRHLHIQVQNLSLDEIALAAGARALGADFDMPVGAQLDVTLTPQDTLAEAAGSLDMGAGYLRFDDPDAEPLMIDSAGARVHWEAATRRLVVDDAAMLMGGTHFALSGDLTPPLNEGDAWLIDLATHGPSAFGAERPGEQPIPIDRFELKSRFEKTQKRLVIDRFALGGPQAGLTLTGQFDWESGPHLKLDASLEPTLTRTVVRVWPSFVASGVRAWFLAHFTDGIVQSGHLSVDLDADTIAALRADRPPPDKAVSIDFAFSGARIDFLSGVPPLAGVDGSGHVSGRTSSVAVTSAFLDAGGGRRLVLTDGSFRVPDAAIKPTPASVAGHLSGSVEAVAALLSRDAFKPYATLPMDPATVRGQIDGRLGLDMKLGPGAGPNDTGISINANLTNFVAEKLVGKEKLEGATIALVVDQAGMKATGQGRMFGAPAQLDIVKPINKSGEAAINFIIDEAARAKQGFGNVAGLSGPIGAHISVPLGVDKPKAEVELDFAKAALDGVLPGIYKPAGRPGKASFVATLGESATSLDQVVIDMGALQARGTMEFGADQTLQVAHFPQLRLSPGDDMHLDAVKSGDQLKLTIRATAIDARPFLKPFTLASGEVKTVAGPASGASLKEAALFKDIDIDLKTGLLTGYNRQVLSGVDLRLGKHGDQLRQFAMNGRFGRDAISGTLTGGGGPGAPQLEMTTADAGALLGFVDLYRHMDGGRLAVNMRLGEGGLAGTLNINDFTLVDEPALRQLVAQGRPPRLAGDENATSGPPPIDANKVSFNRLQVRFQRVGDRLDLHDGVMYGPAIGLSVDGQLDFAHDQVNMNGTFVPAYAVNNLFSQIPLFGMLLGGGSHEGLFAVNYHITGLASAPTLNINPLSMAPGILRKIFGAIDPGAQPPGAGAPVAPPSAAEGK